MARQDRPDLFALTPQAFTKFISAWAAQSAPSPPPYGGIASSDNLQWVQLTDTSKTGDYYPGQRMRWLEESAAFTAEDSVWMALANGATANTSDVWLARDNGDHSESGDERPLFVAGDACCDGSASPLTTKGDLYTYDTADARLPVGADGYRLESDSVEATGLKWVKSKTTNASDPGVSDDNTQGYVVGSLWQNTTTGSVWIAQSVATGVAVWVEYVKRDLIRQLIYFRGCC